MHSTCLIHTNTSTALIPSMRRTQLGFGCRHLQYWRMQPLAQALANGCNNLNYARTFLPFRVRPLAVHRDSRSPNSVEQVLAWLIARVTATDNTIWLSHDMVWQLSRDIVYRTKHVNIWDLVSHICDVPSPPVTECKFCGWKERSRCGMMLVAEHVWK